MISTLTGRERESARPLYEQLLRLRYDIFVGELQWSIPARDHMDVDDYDCDEAFYFFEQADDGRIWSHVRLTPADHCSLLADTFSHLVDARFNPREPSTMECTRFIVRPPDRRRTTKRRLEAQLFSAVVSFCMRNGCAYLQAALDTALFPTFLEMAPQSFPLGLSAPYGGGPDAPGGGNVIAVRCPVNERTLQEVTDYGRLTQGTTCRSGFGVPEHPH